MNSVHHHGGPAFPVVVDQYDYGYEKEMPKAVAPGMTLRDYFAAKAMQALITATVQQAARVDSDVIAGAAYEYADAMLDRREAA